MFESISRSIGLIKASWGVLNKDKEILLFPVLSGFACLLVVISFVIPAILLGAGQNGVEQNQVLMYGGLFLFYLITYFIVIFCNVGLVTCANIRLNGGDPTFSQGFSQAVSHLPKILVWSLISATVGVILSMIRGKDNALGQIVSSLLGTAWTLLTYFVIPVMIIEEKGVIDSIKASASLFRKTWGETVVGQGGIALIFVLLGFAGLIPVILAVFIGNGAVLLTLIGLYLIFVVILAVIGSALQGIYNTALYLYAKTGNVPSAFDSDLIVHAFKPSKGNI